MKKIAIIVLNWKQPQLTLDVTASLLKIDHHGFNFQIIIVDNHSSDNSLELFNQKYSQNSQVTIIDSGDNLGYAAGNNVGIDYALKNNFDYLLIINNDVLVKSDFLEKLFQFHQDNPKYSLICPKIYFAPGHEFHASRYTKKDIGNVIWAVGGHIDWQNVYGTNLGIDEVDHGQYDVVNDQIDFISGCCFLIDAKVFSKISAFDSDYFMYLEDADFCQRTRLAGFKLVYYPGSVIWHINAGSTSAGGNPLQDYFLTRNRLIFGFRYASFKTRFALLRDSFRTYLTSPSVWQKKAVLDYYFHRLGRGTWHK